MNEAIQKRISRRSFAKENISKENIGQIKLWIDETNKISNLNIDFLEDGGNAFNSFRKSYGIFSNVRSMLIMKGNKDDNNLKEKVGYYGEDLILKITELGLGTCWVGGTYDNSKFIIPDNEMLICIILIGNIQKSLKDSMVRTIAGSKNRKDIKERIVADKEISDWIISGLEAMKLAPSSMNSQKPTVYYKNDNIIMKVPDDSKFNMIDLGIAKKHFELGALNGKFEFGNGGKYILN